VLEHKRLSCLNSDGKEEEGARQGTDTGEAADKLHTSVALVQGHGGILRWRITPGKESLPALTLSSDDLESPVRSECCERQCSHAERVGDSSSWLPANKEC
jgi:hypothetical protein